MATWAQFAQSAPEMAALGLKLLKKFPGEELRPEIAYLATVQEDGSPQVHPVCPVIAGEHLYVSIGPKSPKLRDLRHNGRYMLHAMPGKDNDEFSVRGRAAEANDAVTRAEVVAAASASGLNIKEHEIIFRFDIERADSAYWENVGQPDARPIRRRWPERR